ncbi:CsbD family protein [Adhaeribacter sp. BT258]|uniref:CsbD family protein n=2 Tax=Adhaeribacter terrigena TaxID=2793070 RepID=A0ABS1BX92_9BACT|nr:CsbD family protein [Adhaeribacter terrigena]
MAALAGASAGVIAGLLMAPESGKSTIDSLKRSAMRLGDQMDETFRVAMNKMESMGLARSGDSLQIQGNWDQVKGKMKAQYGTLTDQDLAYLEGQEDKFLGNLETKLGKSKRELVRWINSLA